MKIYNTTSGILVERDGEYFRPQNTTWDSFVNRKNLYSTIEAELNTYTQDRSLVSRLSDNLRAPIGSQEVWASGVTYYRSRVARIEESKDAGGGDFYARVYEAERPELFFKAPAYRTVGPNQLVRIRKDSAWNVPEPELALFISSEGTIEGYTIGNDMSSRDIEGENPLYLPQAKSYDGSAALGPCLLVKQEPIRPDSLITLEIIRGSDVVFASSIAINQMKRTHSELVEYLMKELTFPSGVYLMTGTGIIPPDDFTLLPGDEVAISIEGIGTLNNTVAQQTLVPSML